MVEVSQHSQHDMILFFVLIITRLIARLISSHKKAPAYEIYGILWPMIQSWRLSYSTVVEHKSYCKQKITWQQRCFHLASASVPWGRVVVGKGESIISYEQKGYGRKVMSLGMGWDTVAV